MLMNVQIETLSELVRLGCSEAERAFPQMVTFDIELVLEAKRAVSSDSIKDTADYMGVVSLIEKLCKECSWKLLEKMSYDIACEIMRFSEAITQVRISSKKRLVKNAAGVSAEVTVSRKDL